MTILTDVKSAIDSPKDAPDNIKQLVALVFDDLTDDEKKAAKKQKWATDSEEASPAKEDIPKAHKAEKAKQEAATTEPAGGAAK